MTCQQFSDFIRAWLDGELSEGQRSSFDEHMALCSECAQYLDNYREAMELGKSAYLPLDAEALHAEVPEDLVQAVLAARRRA
ncbi:MAG: anti-sigma factor RsiW [Pseudohongiellaceae bacterium]|jgi:anti-sigma factor RsiW